MLSLASLAVLAAGCESLETAGEVAELVASGGMFELRDPLREIVGGPRVLILALDGVGYDALVRAFDEGRFSRLSSGMGRAAGSLPEVHPMVTVLPSITLAAWTSLFTGSPPGVTGIPGNEWFERDTRAFRAPAPVSVKGSSDALSVVTDGAIGEWSRTPTLFERADVRAHVSILPAHRGADVLTIPDAEDLADLLAGFVEGVARDEIIEREAFQEIDQASVEEAVNAIQEHGVPDLQIVYFPGIDLYTHAVSDPLEAQQRYIAEVLDPTVETLIEAYRAAAVWEGTWVVVVSDHGHTPVPGDEEHALSARSDIASLLDTLGWRPRPPELSTDVDDFQAVVAYQGAFAYVYLTDRSVCPEEGTACDWSRRAPSSEVERVTAELHSRLSGQNAGARRLEMAFIPRRDNAGQFEGIDVWTDAGPRSIEALSLPDEGMSFRLEERLRWLLDGPQGHRAGDIVLMARSGAWVPEDARYYFSHPYRSWHGSPDPSDSRIGLVVQRVGGSDGEVEIPSDLTQLDFTSLILGLLGRGDAARPPGR